MKNQKNYYLGLDIGTDSVGYAATNEEYDLLKFKGEPMWGVHLFDEASLKAERRAFRAARRRLDRRQQRVKLVQEMFSHEIAKVDCNFYRRIRESALWREDAQDAYCLFADAGYTDSDYHKEYPTIHHLICELIENKNPHDVRLVYLACAWLVAHRGHFFSDVSKENIGEILNVETNYQNLMNLFEGAQPWSCEPEAFGEVLKKRNGVNAKYKELCMLLYHAPKAPKTKPDGEEVLYSTEHILKLLCGGTASAKDLFGKDEYKEIPSFTLNKSDEDLAGILSELGDDSELIIRLKAVFDWAVLADILSGASYISEKKVEIYRAHKQDLALLKKLSHKYLSQEKRRELLRDETKDGYAKYRQSGKQEDFYKYIKGLFKDIKPEDADAELFAEMYAKMDANTFCPKQVVSDNRVIPYQVYWIELKQILENASAYLPFLEETDADGYKTKDKILSVMEFRIPYFVGPLNSKSSHAWLYRKNGAEGKILPWNFEQMVDLDKSEQAFIDRMTNTCTYLPNQDVMPKCSLLHEKFQVLNEINTITIHGQRIPVGLKQQIYQDLFLKKKKVSVKDIKNYLICGGYYTADDIDTLGGIDETIKNSLSSAHSFRRLMESGQLHEADVEDIILHATYTEDRTRMAGWLEKQYSALSEADRKYILGIKIKDFARISKALLIDVYGTETDTETGEAMSVMERMWNENLNLMEILSERYTYRTLIEQENEAYYRENPKTLDERMDEMFISNAVKRPILRTLDIISDIVKVNGGAPKKIFIEMARGDKPEKKGKRTDSRYEQLKALYKKCDLEDVREMEAQLEAMGEDRDNRLQSEKLFLYYLQLGKSMYSGTPIDLSQLLGDSYNVDHIYPQSKVKDDSLLQNKVLVLSTENGTKGDAYPIAEDIRRKMQGWWKKLLDCELITKEKYKRLTRHTPFDENEAWGFINRQLVETRQSTKAIATLLKERYPETDIVYVKAGMVSEFRQEFDMLKSRAVNDLHHAKDAYLNIVVGNVYHERFTRQWFLKNQNSYNLKVKTLFAGFVKVGERVIWNGSESIEKIKHIVQNKNAIHLTRYAFCRKGGLFDQQPKAFPSATIPRKEGLPVEKYGGYCKPTASFYVLARYKNGKKTEVMLVPVDLLSAGAFADSAETAKQYTENMIEQITGKQAESLDFPIGMRKIKINTVFEFDGTRMCLAGKSNGGKSMIPSLTMPLVLPYTWEKYIKHLERFTEKKKEHPNMIYREEYDKVSAEQNLALYDLLTEKLGKNPYSKRPNNPIETLLKGREKFANADIFAQANCLMQILIIFGRISGGCDLQTIGGVGSAAAMKSFSSMLSNWKKYYSDVRIVDQSASGLYETQSVNLLELL